jgi:uracil-DNA glycosylase
MPLTNSQLTNQLQVLLTEIHECRYCAAHLPQTPRPILRAQTTARLLIVGQAPGIRVHTTGIPWNDPSGDRLRDWLQMDRNQFYDDQQIAIIPIGLCYPGKGKSGDLPPRPECAPRWQPLLQANLPNIQLTLLIGQYAQHYYLGTQAKNTLTATVQNWHNYLPQFLPLPHPSPRNQLWLKRNAWFETQVLPALRHQVARVLST